MDLESYIFNEVSSETITFETNENERIVLGYSKVSIEVNDGQKLALVVRDRSQVNLIIRGNGSAFVDASGWSDIFTNIHDTGKVELVVNERPQITANISDEGTLKRGNKTFFSHPDPLFIDSKEANRDHRIQTVKHLGVYKVWLKVAEEGAKGVLEEELDISVSNSDLITNKEEVLKKAFQLYDQLQSFQKAKNIVDPRLTQTFESLDCLRKETWPTSNEELLP